MMRPRPFLLLIAGFALALNEILADKELQYWILNSA
jgi:hypothetical protein